jgi:tRNA threonylcarbamoyladenosine biosynthesis protein TsaE
VILTLRCHTDSPEETRRLGRALGASLRPGGFVGFEGQLGSGKTVMIQGAAQALGFDGYVTSPSFVIVNEYPGRVPILHVDLYRIADPRELEDIGYREIYFGDGVALVEWADRAPEFLPPGRLTVAIEIVGESAREITITADGPEGENTLARLRETLDGAADCAS